MKRNFATIFLTALLCAVTFGSLRAQTISTVAGRMVIDGIAATAQGLYVPQGIAIDNVGNIYLSDNNNNRIRKINTAGIITTIGGSGLGAVRDYGDGGPATSAGINGPMGVAVDSMGNVYFVTYGFRIRKINTAGIISTIAGNGINGFSGDGGPATAASFSWGAGIAVDKIGNVYFSDDLNQRIRKISTSGIISTVAGNGTAGFSGDSGPATAAEINYAWGVAVDTFGNIFIADGNNNRIRKVNTSGIISTIAGNGTAGYSGDGGAATSAEINLPWTLCADINGNVFITDVYNNRIRKISTTGIITTVAGDSLAGYTGDGGPATNAELNQPFGVAVNNSGKICMIDGTNYGQYVRVVNAAGIINTVAGNGTYGFSGDGIAATAAELGQPISVRTDSTGNIYVADERNNRIRKINTSGIISTIAGTGVPGFTGDGGLATAAELNAPYYINLDHSGNIYFADEANNCVRKINTSGIISTIAGTGVSGFSGDDSLASGAQLNQPNGILIDNSGNIYIADGGNNRIRKINTSGIIKTIAGTGTAAYSGNGVPATAAELNNPYGMVFDNVGNLIFADMANNRIRKIDTAGIIHTIAGTGTAGYTGNGGPATLARLNNPSDLVMDAYGNILVLDYSNSVVRKINTAGIITTIAGNDTAGFQGDGGPSVNGEMNNPLGMAIDINGNLYVADNNNNRIRYIAIPPVIVPETFATNQIFSVHPNPNTGSFTVSIAGSGENISISLLDLTGRIIKSKNHIPVATKDAVIFNAYGLSAGMYIVSVDIDGKISNQRIMVLE